MSKFEIHCTWSVEITRKVAKQLKKLPVAAQERFDLLAKELEAAGPHAARWSHFGKLRVAGKEAYHCHIKSGRPTYVACWEVVNKQIRIIEVYYVGTHENAPY